jgi:hypothetical protein
MITVLPEPEVGARKQRTDHGATPKSSGIRIWVGGDPGKLEVYGWAAWSPAKAILTLRNPGDERQSMSIDVGEAFGAATGSVASISGKQPMEAG